MSEKAQILKGILEWCIVKVISNNKAYGYEISQKLIEYGFQEVSEGTIYPLLLRLEKSGLISATFEESSLGPKRKYYTVTTPGEIELAAFRERWIQLADSINRLLGIGSDELKTRNIIQGADR
jgi:PadR family transcriptional regulator, regulatory protein PadR